MNRPHRSDSYETCEKATSAIEPGRRVCRPKQGKLKGTILACNSAIQNYLATLKQAHRASPNKLPKQPTENLISIAPVLRRVLNIGRKGHAALFALLIMRKIAMPETTIEHNLGFDWMLVVKGPYSFDIMSSAYLEASRVC